MEGDNDPSANPDDPVVEWDTTFIQAMGDHRFSDALAVLLRQEADEVRAKSWDLLTLYFASVDEFELARTAELGERDNGTTNEISDEQLLADILENLAREMTPKCLLMVELDVLRRIRSLALFTRLVESISEKLQAIDKFNKATFLWCVQVVAGTLGKLAPPREDRLESAEERMLMDASEEVVAIVGRCRALADFLDANVTFLKTRLFIDQLTVRDRLQVCSHTLKHFGTTLGLLDLSGPRSAEGQRGAPSAQHSLSIKLARILSSIADPISVLQLSSESSQSDSAEDSEEDDLSVPSISAAVFCYIIFCLSEDFPRLYSPALLSDLVFTFSRVLVTSPKPMHILKGLTLIEDVLPSYLGPVIVEDDEVITVRRLLRALLEVMTSCPLKEARDSAMPCWEKLFGRCPPAMKAAILTSLFRSLEQPSVRGFLVDQLRTFLGRQEDNHNLSDQINDTIQQVVFLADGEKTDLLDQSEHILASLNLVRFAMTKKCLRKAAHLDSYLSHLKKGLQLSRAHYKLQLDMPEAERAQTTSLLPNIPVDMEKDVLKQALTRFDLLEFVLGIVQDQYDNVR